MNVKIKNIYIYNNVLLSDQEIIELANLENYPSFIKTNEQKIIKKLKSNQYIKNVKVKKSLVATINIIIEEYVPLFEDSLTGKLIADFNVELDKDNKIIGVPV